MAERRFAPDTPELRSEWGNFAWDAANAKAAALLSAIDVLFGECDR